MSSNHSGTLLDRVLAQCDASPGRLAIDAHDGIWTYAELIGAARTISAALRQSGMQPGDPVLISAPISTGAAVSMLAVLLGGGVIVPVPEHLAERALLERRQVAGARLVIAVGPCADGLEPAVGVSIDGRSVERLDGSRYWGGTGSVSTLEQSDADDSSTPPVSSDSPAYVFFTSGTTGRVRGVLGIHRSVDRFLHWQAERFSIGSDDRVAFLTSVGFDVVLRNVFLPWSVGACLVVPPNMDELVDVPAWMIEQRITVVHLTPTVAENWLNASSVTGGSSSLRRTFFSGEPLHGTQVRRWRSTVGSGMVVNLYGPTETCMIRTAYEVPDEIGAGVLPVGLPIPGTTISLDHSAAGVDATLGEVVVHTVDGTLGYVGDPEAWLSVAAPGSEVGELTYRTGDLGYVGSDGDLVLVGRCSDEVKVHGQRVDPADIAARLRRLDGVSAAAAFVETDAAGNRELVAAIVPRGGNITAESVRSALADELAPALVPRWVAVVVALPLTPNGKLDRRAVLRAAERGVESVGDDESDPVVVDFVVRLWRRLFPGATITPTSNFFEVGGHSLPAIRVLHEVREHFGVSLPLRRLYVADTPMLVAREVRRARDAAAETALRTRDDRNDQRGSRSTHSGSVTRLAATRMQRRFLDMHDLDPELVSSVLVVARSVVGSLDRDALWRALQRLAQRHDAMRTWFDVEAREQCVAESVVLSFDEVDATGADDATIDAILRDRVAPNVGEWPLVRPILVRHAADCWVVALVSQHAAVDGRSQDILIDDLRRLYEAEVRGGEADLPALRSGARDVLERDRAMQDDGTLAADIAFWRERLAGHQLGLALPADRPRSPSVLVDGAEVRTRLSPQLRSGLERLARDGGGSLFRVLAGLWAAYLARTCDEDDVVLTTPAHLRELEDGADLCGMFVMRIPLLLRPEPGLSVAELLARTSGEVSLAGRRRHISIDDVVPAGHVALDPGRTRPFHLGVNLLGWRERVPAPDVSGALWSWIPDSTERPIQELELRVFASEQHHLTAYLRYDSHVHDEHSMVDMLLDFVAFCEAAVVDPQRPVGMLPVGRAAAQAAEVDGDRTVIVDGDRKVSQSALDQRVQAIAGALVAADVSVGDLVAVALERGTDFVASVLAAHRVGAAFVPLARDAPDAWNSMVLQRTRPSVVITVGEPTFEVGGASVLRLDRPGVSFPCAVASRVVPPSTAAYVIHTSGSSGRPKGVVIPRGELDAHLRAAASEYGITPDDTLMQIHRIAFDVAVDEVFLPLYVGCRLVIVHDQVLALGPDALLAEVARCGVTVMHLPTSMFHSMVATCAGTGTPSPAGVREVIVAGQAMDPAVVRRWLDWVGSGVRLVNAYGPTEATVIVTTATMTPGMLRDGEPCPIGRPLDGVLTRVVDAQLHDVPVGSRGELLLGGTQLATEYLGDPELTARCFLVEGAQRWYRTGDVVSVRDDGMLVYHGRLDDQVKVRGYRVEPGQVESALLSLDGVAESAVVAVPEGEHGDSLLAAFVVPTAADSTSVDRLRHGLNGLLPQYLVPTYIELVPQLPRTAGNKPDRGRLRGAVLSRRAATPAVVAGPRTEPAGPTQQRFWLLRQMDDRDLYQIVCNWVLAPGTDGRDVERAVGELVGRHEVLRTRLEYRTASGLVQVIDPPDMPWWIEQDSVGLEEVWADLTVPFSLDREWPVRFALERRVDAGPVLHMVLHHVAGDASSLGVITAELRSLLPARGESSPADGEQSGRKREVPAQYSERARSERAYVEAVEGPVREDLAHWRRVLRGAPLKRGEHGASASGSLAGSTVNRATRSVEPALHELIRSASAALRTTPATLVIAAAAAVAARTDRLDEVVIGVPVSTRASSADAQTIGPFVNTLPLRVPVGRGSSFADLVGVVGTALADALEHRDIPFERIMESLDDGGGVPRLDWVVNVFDTANRAALFGETAGSANGFPRLVIPDRVPVAARFDVTLIASFGETPLLAGEVSGSVESFAADGLLRGVVGFLEQALAAPHAALANIGLQPPGERVFREAERQQSTRAGVVRAGLGDLFAEQVRLHGDRRAVVDHGTTLTYRELESAAERLAGRLTVAGVSRGNAVALLLDRSADFVVAVLAVVRLGAVYVPIDPAQPERRTRAILDAAGATVVVCRDASGAVDVQRRGTNSTNPQWPGRATDDSTGDPSAAPLYAMFTSGSTGEPKGVVIPHRAVTRLVRGADYVQLGPDDVVAFGSNPAFDASTWEVWGALLNGARLVVLDPDTVTSPSLYAVAIREHGITAAFVTTALLHVVAALQPHAPAALRTLLFGGERCDPAAVAAVLNACPATRLLHVYGPTECTTFATWHEVTHADVSSGLIPIGTPISNTQSWVLDGSLHEMPAGMTGELYLGGNGLALGYLGDPVLTSDRFGSLRVADGAVTAYRTGDLVRRLPDGAIEFVGRVDRQVKIRGFRVQPEEIEAVLTGHPAVRAAIVMVEGSSDGAYLVGAVEATGLSAGDLRSYLVDRLPAAMIPSRLVVLPTLPLNANGKIDRRAVAVLVETSTEPMHRATDVRADDPVVAPGTPGPAADHLRVLLEPIWCDLLGLANADPDASFFDLGGHSLLAVRLLAEVRRVSGVSLSLSALAARPTLRSLVDSVGLALSHQTSSTSHASMVALRLGEGAPLCFVHSGAGHLLDYASLLSHLQTERNMIGIVGRGIDGRAPFHRSFARMGAAYGGMLATRVAGHMDQDASAGAGGPVLIGFSSGALVAVETVRDMQRRGTRVGGLVLLDPSRGPWRGDDASAAADRPSHKVAEGVVATQPAAPQGIRRVSFRRKVVNSVRYRSSLVRSRLMGSLAWILAVAAGRDRRNRLVLTHHQHITRRYRPTPLETPVPTLLVVIRRGLDDTEEITRERGFWEPLVGGPLEVVIVDGEHTGTDGFLAGSRAAASAVCIDRFVSGVDP